MTSRYVGFEVYCLFVGKYDVGEKLFCGKVSYTKALFARVNDEINAFLVEFKSFAERALLFYCKAKGLASSL
jgi:hypothetical protein